MGPTEREFYQQRPGYWQQVSHNLAGWLHLQRDATALDVVMLLPLFPLLVLAVFWWTPWERWFFKEMPKTITDIRPELTRFCRADVRADGSGRQDAFDQFSDRRTL